MHVLLFSPAAFPRLSFPGLGFLFYVFTLPNFPGTVTSLVQTGRGPSRILPEASSHAWASPKAVESFPALRVLFCFLSVTPYIRGASGLGLAEKSKGKSTPKEHSQGAPQDHKQK